MAIRPPRRVNNRPASAGALTLSAVSGRKAGGTSLEAGQEAGATAAVNDDQQEILDLLERSLRATAPSGDDEELDFVIQHMRKAVASADLRPETTGIDRSAWVDTLETLASEGLLVGQEREDLIRQFGEATDSLQTREARVALELAQRIERDGERAAMEWLATLRSNTAPTRDAGGGALDGGLVLPGKQSITRSRSRRLRGPPGSA